MTLEDFKKYYSKSKYVAHGAHKECFVYNEEPLATKPIVYLRNRTLTSVSPSAVRAFENSISNKVKLTNEITDDGISITRVLGGFLANGKRVEVQEQGPGDVICAFTLKNAFSRFMRGIDITGLTKEKIETLSYGKQFFYNLEMKEKLRNAPQEQYDKLCSDVQKLTYKYSIPLIDLHPENLLYDEEKGFTLIDLDLNRDGPVCANDLEILDRLFCSIKIMDRYYENHYPDFVYDNKKSNKEIIEKMLNGALNSNFIFDNYKIASYYIKGIIATHAHPDDIEELFNSFNLKYVHKYKPYNK